MEAHGYRSLHINKYDIEITNELFACRIFWARVISSETQSLFTSNTKHTFYEIQYALEGRIGMVIGEEEKVYFDHSHFVVIPPDTYHQIVDGDSTGARFIMAFDIRPKDDALRPAMRQLSRVLPHRESAAMRPLLSLILEKSYRNDALRKGLLHSLLESFLLEILETVASAGTDPAGAYKAEPDGERATEITAFIHALNGIGVRVTDVAAHFHLSERQLNRVLIAATGKSAGDWIAHEKMKKIEELTAATSLSLQEIAALCGFSDGYAMNKFFKRHAKTTLSEFRRIARRERSGKSG